jgi:hypothetical protein
MIHRHRRPEIGRVQKLFPATCRRGESPPEVFFIAMLASGVISEYSALEYGSIAVASWLSPPPCASCLDLVSCFTWLRSPLCNSTCCVCWDPMNIGVMIELMCWILSYVFSMLFMILHALRC